MIENEITVKKNNFTFKVIDDDLFHRPAGFDYWEKFYPDSEPSVFKVYDRLLNKEKDFLDIGAWIGPNTLYAAELSRKVVAVEPDPIAFNFLKKNVEVNNFENVTLLEKAFSAKEKVTIDTSVELGDSMTRVLDSIQLSKGIVDGIGMKDLLLMGDYSLIKIDIEGYESVVIPCFEKELIEANIPMVISLHTPFNLMKEQGHQDLVLSLSRIYKKAFDDYGNSLEVTDLPEGFGCFFLTNEE